MLAGPIMSERPTIYQLLARPWTATELDGRLIAASTRGIHDLDAHEHFARPIACLATAIPRLISLAVATHAIQLATSDSGPTLLPEPIIDTIERTSSGALHRCQLALDLDAAAAGYEPEEFVATARDLAAELLERLAPSPESRSVAAHAQEAGRWTAIAIDLLDRDDHAAFAEAAADCLGRLLVLCVFADAAAGRLAATSSSR